MEKIYLKDYQAPDFSIPQTFLNFDIRSESEVIVTAELKFQRAHSKTTDLVLDGGELNLLQVKMNGKVLSADEYEATPSQLKVKNPPAEFTLETQVKIHPDKNTALSGLYKTGPYLMTQCEAQGFRRITYFLDRPDVLSSYTVKIEADSKKYPHLLANGDCTESKDLSNGRRQVTWKDPHKKPSYLFALVAGDLAVIRDEFKTRSGKSVKLEIYSEPAKIDQCHYAMESLIKSMKWDEERFGLEYDLSTYMIVATDDFNAGAMENKGLNIFNSRLVLANLETATDKRFEAIESVIAHEYFHNWTGNRVTVRDWFHLSLKEGLTVFRDQEFSMDQISRDLVRIQNVIDLRESQFAEDQGPNAHPIRPESCYSVDNFYTATIYEKGAEVIRMMQTMVGRPGFRKGMDLYFKRHDGQAVIIEDFASAIADANNIPKGAWDQFKLWYSQAGTPQVTVEESFDASKKRYHLKLSQSCPSTPGQSQKLPFHIPLELEWFGAEGQALKVNHPRLTKNTEGKQLFHLTEIATEITLENLSEKPILSLNRGFSAPIELKWERPLAELFFLYRNDTDAFNRWESGQKLFQDEFQRLLKDPKARPEPFLVQAMEHILKSQDLNSALKATMLGFPSLGYLAQIIPGFEAESFEQAIHSLYRNYGKALKNLLEETHQNMVKLASKEVHPTARGHRALKNWALMMLCWEGSGVTLMDRQYHESSLMTDKEAALYSLIQHSTELGQKALDQYFNQWKEDGLMLNSWWRVQASAERPDTLERVKGLLKNEKFKMTNPNAVYSLLGVFGDNLTQFHRGEGEAYDFMAQKILEVDRLNPQVAARISGCFDFCLKVKEPLQNKARKTLKALVDQGLSKNTYEIISRTLTSLG